MPWNPAFQIIAKLGGEQAVSEVTGTSYTAPYRWQSAVAKGGTGGRVPGKHIPKLLDAARERGVELSAAEFFATPGLVEQGKGVAA